MGTLQRELPEDPQDLHAWHSNVCLRNTLDLPCKIPLSTCQNVEVVRMSTESKEHAPGGNSLEWGRASRHAPQPTATAVYKRMHPRAPSTRIRYARVRARASLAHVALHACRRRRPADALPAGGRGADDVRTSGVEELLPPSGVAPVPVGVDGQVVVPGGDAHIGASRLRALRTGAASPHQRC